jgi:aminoglycoside phosphotransferase (APT) family kinase protein
LDTPVDTTTVTEPPPELAPVRYGEDLDWEALATYLRTHIADLDGECRVLQFPNGSANLTYLLEFGERRLVVRRPPFGAIAPGAHDMRREYRTLSTLWQRFDKAPRAYLLCTDQEVVGSDFVVTEYRAGEVIWGVLPAPMASLPDCGRRVGTALVDALAELHRVEPASVGLADLGRPDGFLERQVSGWAKRWELAALPDSEPLMPELGRRLAAAIPRPPAVAILHNDYKLDNCQFDPADPDRVKSIFDWDMATLGDPFVDLGILLNYWPDPSDTAEDRPLHYPGLEALGLPTRGEVVQRYAEQTGFDVGDVHWYEAFACWKTAVVLQQLFTRFVRGESTDPRMADRGPKVSPQARRALLILDRSGY